MTKECIEFAKQILTLKGGEPSCKTIESKYLLSCLFRSVRVVGGNNMKKLSFKKSKLFWLYIVVGAILLLGAILLAPFWQGTDAPFSNWGASIVNITMGAVLLMYLIFYLAKKLLNASNPKIQLLTIIEFIVLTIIALGCFLAQFNILRITQPCLILGIALWSRGAIEIVRAYLYRGATDSKYPAWLLVVAIAMVTFGAYIIAAPFFTALHLQWLIVSAIFVFGGFMIFYGIKVKP